jgi:DNA repair protein RadC
MERRRVRRECAVSALLVRSARGRYRAADRDEILNAAAQFQVRELRGDYMNNPTTARSFLRSVLASREAECFCALWLTTRYQVIAFDVLFTGTLDRATVHPREVVKAAIARNAAAVILAHNHPSGVAEFSQADELITRRLKEALALIDVRVVDHVLVAGAGTQSMSEHGLL